jgi:hypothetical protein
MYTDELFDDEALEKKSTYDEGSSDRGQDGLYRIDLDKVSPENKQRGYRAKLRFLPNITDNPEFIKAYAGDKYNEDMKAAVGPSSYEKITHYLRLGEIEGVKHLAGYYDDPTNINPKTQKPYTTEKWGPLAKTFFALNKSKNALEVEKAKLIQYSKKYFSYVLVLEDEQQPELEGKIMILSYGKQIKDIIESERNGETTGISCNVFSLNKGKDFVLLAKEKTWKNDAGNDVKAPDYTKSRFYEDTTPISLPKKDENGKIVKWITVPTEDGKIAATHQDKIASFLLSREHQLEDFAGQAWDEEKQGKVNEAIDYFTGKVSGNATSTSQSSTTEEEPDDFSFDDVSSEEEVSESTSMDDDDDFDDLEF